MESWGDDKGFEKADLNRNQGSKKVGHVERIMSELDFSFGGGGE